MTYQDENSPFFQGSAGPADSFSGGSLQGHEQGQGNEPVPFAEPGNAVEPQQQAPLPQPEVEGQPRAASVTLGEVRDNLVASQDTQESEPPTLESTESGINDAFNKRFGTAGALELDHDSTPPELPTQANTAPIAEVNLQDAVVRDGIPMTEVAPAKLVSRAVEPEVVEPLPVAFEAEENSAGLIEKIEEEKIESSIPQIQKSERIEDSSRLEPIKQPKRGSVEDRKERLKRVAQKNVSSEVVDKLPDVSQGPPVDLKPGEAANSDIPDL